MDRGKCPSCGRSGAKWKDVENYDYLESGLRNIVLASGVVWVECAACDQEFRFLPREQQLLQLLAVALLLHPAPLRPEEMRYLRAQCDLTQDQLASAIGVRRATVTDRENGVRIGKGDELLFRAVILGKFNELLREPRRCFLSTAQRRRLDLVAPFLVQWAASDGSVPENRAVRLSCRRQRWALLDAA